MSNQHRVAYTRHVLERICTVAEMSIEEWYNELDTWGQDIDYIEEREKKLAAQKKKLTDLKKQAVGVLRSIYNSLEEGKPTED